MGILSGLAAPIVSAIAGSLFNTLEQGWEAYVKKEISADELKAKITQALVAAFVEVEKSYADALSKNFAAFMGAAKDSKLFQSVWATVVLSQLMVLLWGQIGLPFFMYKTGLPFPSAGATIDWAYAIITACLGVGLMMPKAGDLAASFKSLIGK